MDNINELLCDLFGLIMASVFLSLYLKCMKCLEFSLKQSSDGYGGKGNHAEWETCEINLAKY